MKEYEYTCQPLPDVSTDIIKIWLNFYRRNTVCYAFLNMFYLYEL